MRLLQKIESIADMSPHIRLFYSIYYTFSNVDTSLFESTYQYNKVNGYLLHANTFKDKLQCRSNHIKNHNVVDLFYLADYYI